MGIMYHYVNNEIYVIYESHIYILQLSGWWFQLLWKNISQLGVWFPICEKHVPNHQPVYNKNDEHPKFRIMYHYEHPNQWE